MYRDKLLELVKWKERASRAPLIIRGARQVGKSWLVREHGKIYTHFIEVNLELIQKESGCDEVEENEKEEIELIRRTIHSNIFALAEQSGITKVIEVNTLMGLDIVNMYLLGPSTC